jgi:hypothetical protein
VLIWRDRALQIDIPIEQLASIAWRADNQTLITAIEYPCAVEAWDVVTGSQVALSSQFFEWTPKSCSNLKLRPDGEVVVISNYTPSNAKPYDIQLVNLRTAAVQADYPITATTDEWWPIEFQWSADSQQLVVVLASNKTRKGNRKNLTFTGDDLKLISETTPYFRYETAADRQVQQTQAWNAEHTQLARISKDGLIEIVPR